MKIDMANKNVFQKAEQIRKLATSHFGRELSRTEIKSVLSKANSYFRGKVKNIDDSILGFLMKLQDNDIKPDRAYNFFRVAELPPEWKEKIYARKISMNRALKLFSDAQERRKLELEHIVFTEGMKALEGLKYAQKNS
jgi:hypothetical protein